MNRSPAVTNRNGTPLFGNYPYSGLDLDCDLPARIAQTQAHAACQRLGARRHRIFEPVVHLRCHPGPSRTVCLLSGHLRVSLRCAHAARPLAGPPLAHRFSYMEIFAAGPHCGKLVADWAGRFCRSRRRLAPARRSLAFFCRAPALLRTAHADRPPNLLGAPCGIPHLSDVRPRTPS